MAGLPYSAQNARLLYRAMFWAAHKEEEMYKAFSSNPETECSYYPETGKYTVINNCTQPRKTVFYDMECNTRELTLAGNQLFVLSNSNCKQ